MTYADHPRSRRVRFIAKRAALVLLPLFAACSTSSSLTIEDSLVGRLGPDQMGRIQEARAVHHSAADLLSGADREMQWSKDQLQLARSERVVAVARWKHAGLAVKVIERDGRASQLQRAQSELALSEVLVERSEALIELRKWELDLGEAQLKYAKLHESAAGSKVELEKARAISRLDLVAATEISVEDFEHEVEDRERLVPRAKEDVEFLTERVREAQEQFDLVEARVVSMRGEGLGGSSMPAKPLTPAQGGQPAADPSKPSPTTNDTVKPVPPATPTKPDDPTATTPTTPKKKPMFRYPGKGGKRPPTNDGNGLLPMTMPEPTEADALPSTTLRTSAGGTPTEESQDADSDSDSDPTNESDIE